MSRIQQIMPKIKFNLDYLNYMISNNDIIDARVDTSHGSYDLIIFYSNVNRDILEMCIKNGDLLGIIIYSNLVFEKNKFLIWKCRYDVGDVNDCKLIFDFKVKKFKLVDIVAKLNKK